jgi:hypothetical protein
MKAIIREALKYSDDELFTFSYNNNVMKVHTNSHRKYLNPFFWPQICSAGIVEV